MNGHVAETISEINGALLGQDALHRHVKVGGVAVAADRHARAGHQGCALREAITAGVVERERHPAAVGVGAAGVDGRDRVIHRDTIAARVDRDIPRVKELDAAVGAGVGRA